MAGIASQKHFDQSRGLMAENHLSHLWKCLPLLPVLFHVWFADIAAKGSRNGGSTDRMANFEMQPLVFWWC